MTSQGPIRRRRDELVARLPPWLQSRAGITFLTIAAVLGLAGLVVALVTGNPAPAIVVLLLSLVGEYQFKHRSAEATPPRHGPSAPDVAWPQARRRFDALRAAYAAHECDPMAVLHLPALSDVTMPSTARFLDAFAEAQALDTDAVPPAAHAAAFAAAVDHAERAWQAARHVAERTRLSHLTADDRSGVERVIKLLTTARDSDNDAERLVAYRRARSELARLDRPGVIRMPPPAQAALEVAGRGQLPA